MKEKHLKMAIDMAVQNVEKGGGPFGAVVVKGGNVIASSANRVTVLNDPTAHAEILAIRKASEKLGTFDLSGCILYTSCEPCPMCLGAIYWSRLDAVYYACDHEDAADAGFDDSYIYRELAKPPSVRNLVMQQSLRFEGLVAFEKWKNSPDKTEY